MAHTCNVQYGSVGIWDILASFLDSGRKWRHAVHLNVQSMIRGVPEFVIYSLISFSELYLHRKHSISLTESQKCFTFTSVHVAGS